VPVKTEIPGQHLSGPALGSARPSAPPAALAYSSGADAGVERYGARNHRLFICFAALLAANTLLLALGSGTRNLVLEPLVQGGVWLCCAGYVLVWVLGQCKFWWRGDGSPPPFSAFALASLGVLVVLALLGNFVFALIVL
jgi:hypothetical protein